MKTKHLLLVALFAVSGTALFAQVSLQQFQNKNPSINGHHHMSAPKHNLNSPTNDGTEAVDELRRYQPQNTFMQKGKSLSNLKNTNELIYECDSSFSYSTYGPKPKIIYTRDASGKEITRLYQNWDSDNGVYKNYILHNYTYDNAGNWLAQVGKYWVPESSEWLNGWIFSNTYDASDNWLTYLYQEWDTENSNWKNIVLSTYTYDASGNQLSFLLNGWDNDTGKWIDQSLNTYTYDEAGNMSSNLYQTKLNTGVGDWKNIYIYRYTFDASRNKLTYMRQNWEPGINEWTDDFLYTYTYDGSGNMLSDLYQEGSAGVGNWLNNHLYSYTYDDNGNMLTDQREFWKGGIGDWQNSSKYTYTYDAAGNMLTWLNQKWKLETNEWLNFINNIYTFNTSGSMISDLYQIWVTEDSVWESRAIKSYSYDASENMLSYLHQSWKDDIGDWVNENKIDYEVDYSMGRVSGAHYKWEDDWVPKDLDFLNLYIFNNLIISSIGSYKVEAYYKSYSLGFDDKPIHPKSITSFCSPNPANETVNVSNPFETEVTLKIYNFKGQLLNEKLIRSKENQVSLENLRHGTYLFELQSGNSRIQNKVVVY